MPTTQTFLWTALPNGVGPDGRLRLSVFLSVRLRSDQGATLGVYPDFRNWAERMQPGGPKFIVEVDAGMGGPAAQVEAERVGDAPDIDLWNALFTNQIPVRPFAFDNFTNRPIVTVPVGTLLEYIKGVYGELAGVAPEQLPRIAPDPAADQRRDVLSRLLGDLVTMQSNLQGDRMDATEAALSRRLANDIQQARATARQQRMANPLGGPLIQPGGSANSPAAAFYKTMLFHYRPENAEPVDIPKDDAARVRFEAEFDFHQMLAALADYPELLRRLGFIFDLTLPADALPQTPNEMTLHKLRVAPEWTSDFPLRQTPPLAQDTWTANVAPNTVYVYAPLNGFTLFAPLSRYSQVAAGVWTPGKSVSLQQVDVDGAALKTLNLAATLARAVNPSLQQSLDAPVETSVPTVRTGGIAVVRSGHAGHLNDGFNRSATLNSRLDSDPPANTDLFAEDLVRGYRVDVMERRTGEWRSLHARTGAYTAAGAALAPIDDEGFTQISVTGPAQPPAAPPNPDEEIYAHESLFTWDGWSLSVSRYGLSLVSPRGEQREIDVEPQDVPNTPMTTLGLSTSFRVKDGTLPRLRFGQGYKMRVRVADLAGNSPTFAEVAALSAAVPNPNSLVLADGDELVYLRFEPVNPPELAPRQIYSPSGDPDAPDAGGFSEGESMERLVIRSNFDRSTEEFAADHPAYQPANERHVAAPKGSASLAERHGMLDSAFDAKNQGLSPDELKERVDAVYRLLAAREGGSLNDPGLATVRVFRTGGAAGEAAGYAVHTEEQLVLPYLPDPWAAGVVFQGLPGMAAGERMEVRFDGASWDEAPPFRLRLVEGEAAPAWDPAARVLTVQLAKAATATVRVTSLFGGDMEMMGIYRWLRDALDQGKITGAEMDAADQAARESRHWMFTPWRELTLVHAVQQPLQPPLTIIDRERREGQTAADLWGEIGLHAGSTAKLDITADWTEPLDDGVDPAGTRILTPHAHVMELPVTLDRGEPRVDLGEGPDALRVEDGSRLIFNTMHARLAREWIEPRLKNPPPGTTEAERRIWQDQFNLAAKIIPHQFGDTKYRHVRYTVSATTRFREYFPPGMAHAPENLQRDSEVLEFDYPSTSRPAVPRILHVLPAFGWQQSADGDGAITSRRIGGALRIYLDRPWWSSGEDERLAVIITGEVPHPLQPLYRFSTFWGSDPLWKSPGLPVPRPADFLNSEQAVLKVRLPDRPTVCTVVPYRVQWDETRKLWYCDMQLDTGGAYFPFVRLALARYQPHGMLKIDPNTGLVITDLRLSPIVAADFVQTVPDRAVTVARDAADPSIVRITVSGVTYTAQRNLDNSIKAVTSSVDVLLQRRDPASEDEAVAWSDTGVMAGLVAGVPDAQGMVLWSGSLTIPGDLQAERLRLVVQEYETLPFAIEPGEQPADGQRFVYVDTVGL